MNSRKGILLAVAVLLFAAAPATAQMPNIDPEQRHLLLAASATVTLQAELDYAAARGFRVAMGSSRGNSEMVLLLERRSESDEKREYKLIATTETVTFQSEIDQAARQGFRAVPRTFITKPHAGSVTEIVVVMERAPGAAKRFEYKLLATTLTSTLEKEWALAERQGYKGLAMLTRSELMVLLEREARA
jgi:hypothetical protein